MDMGTTSMSMDMSTSVVISAAITTATSTASAASSSSTKAMSMGGSSSCKISMLWNWYTIDACFLSKTWHITSKGMFAGSCIGIILLVMILEFLRRAAKEYDRYILLQAQKSHQQVTSTNISPSKTGDGSPVNEPIITTAHSMAHFRPNVFQQAIRAILHMLQFAVAYFIMLMAMYYNGYIIICIFIGALLGSFVFSWENLVLADQKQEASCCCG